MLDKVKVFIVQIGGNVKAGWGVAIVCILGTRQIVSSLMIYALP